MFEWLEKALFNKLEKNIVTFGVVIVSPKPLKKKRRIVVLNIFI